IQVVTLAGCSANVEQASRQPTDIDRLYLDATMAIDQVGNLDATVLRQLIHRIDGLSADGRSDDRCLYQKRRQLLPILLSLAIIEGLAKGREQQDLRVEVRHHLVGLSSAHPDVADRDHCDGREFPAVTLINRQID
ncbi:MAG TPA: hypothetical protein VF920_06825, partial [Dongiaceae bacterium]